MSVIASFFEKGLEYYHYRHFTHLHCSTGDTIRSMRAKWECKNHNIHYDGTASWCLLVFDRCGLGENTMVSYNNTVLLCPKHRIVLHLVV